jgi:hypothetical protein
MDEPAPSANPMRICEVSEIVNYTNYKHCCGFLISDPKRYLLTHILITAVLILYYVVTAEKTPLSLLVITVVLHFAIEVVLIALGLIDPGIIPKILQRYEH